jgi:hypothetical protein
MSQVGVVILGTKMDGKIEVTSRPLESIQRNVEDSFLKF